MVETKSIEMISVKWQHEKVFRRFRIENNEQAYQSLRQNIEELAPNSDNLQIGWRDPDGDETLIGSRKELKEALAHRQDDMLRIHTIENKEDSKATQVKNHVIVIKQKLKNAIAAAKQKALELQKLLTPDLCVQLFVLLVCAGALVFANNNLNKLQEENANLQTEIKNTTEKNAQLEQTHLDLDFDLNVLNLDADTLNDLGKTVVANTLFQLGIALVEIKKFKEAGPVYKLALAISEKALGKDHVKCAHVLNNLGVVWRNQGKYEEAEQHFRAALKIYKEKLGDHDNTSMAKNNLLIVLNKQGKVQEAEEFR